MKNFLNLILIFTFYNLNGQNEISFKEPLKIVAIEKVNSDIKKGTELNATGIIKYTNEDGFGYLKVIAKYIDGSPANFEFKKINSFEFKEIDNIDKAWDKHLLKNVRPFSLYKSPKL